MKRAGLLLVYFCVNLLTFGQFISPGTGVSWTMNDLVQFSGGAVTYQNNEYFIQQAITLSATDTLKILEDHTIKTGTGLLLTIHGVLIVNPPNQAVFTTINTSQFFKGFRFENSNASVIRKALIEFGGGIQVISSDMLIEGCEIRYFDKSNTTGAIQLSQGKTRIINNQLYQNLGPAIASAANALAAPRITGNQLWNNNTSNANTPQINLGNSGSDTIHITGNTIAGYYDMAGGIAVSTLAGGNVCCIIEENIVSNNRYGIAILGNNLEGSIKNNFITDNNIQNNPDLGGSGINLNGGNTNRMKISGNTITGNLWGITIQGQAIPNMGETGFNPGSAGGNYIYDNGNNGVVYALYNNTPQNLKAKNNYWGSNNLDTVEMYIFHQPDNPALGWVDYLPVMPPFTGISQDWDDETSHSIVSRVFPNPFVRKIYVEFTRTLINKTHVTLTMLDLYGNIIAEQKQQVRGSVIEFDNPGIAQGVYLLQIKAGDFMEIRTVVAGH